MKSKLCYYSAVAFFVAALFCAAMTFTGGGNVYRALALLSLALAVMSCIGIWTMRLPKAEELSR